ncbi:unnamed protein product [Gulo gulo]|uniref:Uncharacterized protein n=1 Tax=Gulo gulo TaxID=48420 RepID=A0A9X9MBL0_GULGU|nr:unnamed protein product [Gulo gulo]
MNAVNVEESSGVRQISFDIKEFTQHILLNIRGFIPKKNPINVRSAKERLVRIQPLFDIS